MKYISVNKHIIENNARLGENRPPYEIRNSKVDQHPRRVSAMRYQDASFTMVYDPKNPLISGAVCWIEVDE